MSKRDHSKMNGVENAAGGSKHKRRREAAGPSSDVDIMMAEPTEGKEQLSKEEVKELGMKIWTTVKDAVRDGKPLAEPFLKRVPKKFFPDYYVLIQKPIAMDDIKKRLDNGSYTSLVAVRDDFDLMFANAKQYNQPESEIYLDAKDLAKIAHKAYKKVAPHTGGSGEKSKPPSLTKLLKARLDKLTSKTDEAGRYLSTEFMALPDKKAWPDYYQHIQNPECYDNIYKRLKNKEYSSSAQFAAEVELIFSNAFTYNLEGTQIYEDTLAMKDYFKQLMSDLPPPHNLPRYSQPTNKIKIRLPQQQQPESSKSAAKSISTPVTLRVPKVQPVASTSSAAPKPATQTPAPKLAVNTSVLPVAPVTAPRVAPKATPKAAPKPATPKPAPRSAPKPTLKAPQPLTPAPPAQVAKLKSATPQPVAQVSYAQTATPQISQTTQTSYVPPLVAPVPTAASSLAMAAPPILRTSSVANTQKTVSESPAPVVYPPNRQLRSATLRIQPRGRCLKLDHRDGVRSWSVRLMPGETSILVDQVTYMEEDDDDGSDDEEVDVEKDDEDEDMDVDGTSPKNGRRKKRGRGRPPKKATVAAKAAKTITKKSSAVKLGEVQLKLNNFAITQQADKTWEWSVTLPAGSNVIELGETSGMIWKVYAEKPTEV